MNHSCRHVRESRRGENLWTIILVSRYTLTEARCMAPILLTDLMKFIAASKMSFCNSFNIGSSSRSKTPIFGPLRYLQAIHEAGQDVVGSNF